MISVNLLQKIEEELEEEPTVEENAVSEKLDEEYFIEKEQNINELAENIKKKKRARNF